MVSWGIVKLQPARWRRSCRDDACIIERVLVYGVCLPSSLDSTMNESVLSFVVLSVSVITNNLLTTKSVRGRLIRKREREDTFPVMIQCVDSTADWS